MENTSGFYFCQEGALAFAPNFVETKDFQIYREQKNLYSFPINGWYWFETEDEARMFFNLPPKPPPPNLQQFYEYKPTFIGEENAGNI
jgi:hypothetical protein